MRDCVHRFIDDGCVRGASLAMSPNSQFIACGSYSGVVNLYDRECLVSEKPRPLRAIMNLTTYVDTIAFNTTRYAYMYVQ